MPPPSRGLAQNDELVKDTCVQCSLDNSDVAEAISDSQEDRRLVAYEENV